MIDEEPIKKKRYKLSEHAIERLAERSTIEPADLLETLNKRAYHGILSEIDFGMPKDDLEELRQFYNLSTSQLQKMGHISFKERIHHLVIWSPNDNRPYTCIVDAKSKTVVTVLFARQPDIKNRWQDKVTDDVIASAKRKLDCLQQTKTLTQKFVATVRWIEGIDLRCRTKSVTLPVIPDTPELFEVFRTRISSFVAGGFEVHIIIREKGSDHILREFELESTSFIA